MSNPFFDHPIQQSGVEPVQSQHSGKFYFTTRTCLVPTTLDYATAQSLIGSELPGTVRRVASEPYEYLVKATGEVITLAHRYEYSLNVEPEEQHYSDPIGQKPPAYLAEL